MRLSTFSALRRDLEQLLLYTCGNNTGLHSRRQLGEQSRHFKDYCTVYVLLLPSAECPSKESSSLQTLFCGLKTYVNKSQLYVTNTATKKSGPITCP
jgi:hypothetical protein